MKTNKLAALELRNRQKQHRRNNRQVSQRAQQSLLRIGGVKGIALRSYRTAAPWTEGADLGHFGGTVRANHLEIILAFTLVSKSTYRYWSRLSNFCNWEIS